MRKYRFYALFDGDDAIAVLPTGSRKAVAAALGAYERSRLAAHYGMWRELRGKPDDGETWAEYAEANADSMREVSVRRVSMGRNALLALAADAMLRGRRVAAVEERGSLSMVVAVDGADAGRGEGGGKGGDGGRA